MWTEDWTEEELQDFAKVTNTVLGKYNDTSYLEDWKKGHEGYDGDNKNPELMQSIKNIIAFNRRLGNAAQFIKNTLEKNGGKLF
jgi:hypothetical protein